MIFQGPGTYISPSWYATKKETAKVVPTWNYVVVHAHGALRVIDDRDWLRDFVEKLTNRHEAGRREPWKVTDAPADFIDKQLGAIVGIEVPMTRLIGKWKVSQNRPAADRDGAAEGLRQEGHAGRRGDGRSGASIQERVDADQDSDQDSERTRDGFRCQPLDPRHHR